MRTHSRYELPENSPIAELGRKEVRSILFLSCYLVSSSICVISVQWTFPTICKRRISGHQQLVVKYFQLNKLKYFLIISVKYFSPKRNNLYLYLYVLELIIVSNLL